MDRFLYSLISLASKISSLLLLFSLAACNGEPEIIPEKKATLPFHESGGITELEQPLNPLHNGACSWSSTNGGTITVNLQSGETAVLFRNSSGTFFLNGETCTGSSTTATTGNTRTINIAAETTDGDETVILDFIPGIFGTGSYASPGITVNLGTSGNDAFKIRGYTSADYITLGKSGSVTSIALNADNYADVVFSGTVPPFTFSLVEGNDRFSAAGGYGTGSSAYDVALTIYGGPGNDTVIGGSANDVIYAGEGNDTLQGGLGDDSLYGEEGDDYFQEGSSSNGADFMSAGSGTDTVDYSLRTASVTIVLDGVSNSGQSGENDILDSAFENAYGGSGDDTITGNNSSNLLKGNGGNDIIYGKANNDLLYGGDGNDTFMEEGLGPNGADSFYGNAGIDLVDYSSRTGALTVTINSALASSGESNEKDRILSDVENIKGGSANDTITGNYGDNTIWGLGGNDIIKGGSGSDVIYGGLGNDSLAGEAGDDTFLEEGPVSNGSDEFHGGTGTDTVDYTSRTASLTVTMDGTEANDGETGENDNVKDDVERLLCPTANYVCLATGNSKNNEMVGGTANDSFDGGDGDDTLDGAGGDNTLDGGDGDGDFCMNWGAGTTVRCEM